LYRGSGDSYEIQVFGKEGAFERIIRRPIPNPPVTERDKARHRKDWLENNSEWARRRADELEYPQTKPAYGTVVVDALGNVWVAEYSRGHNDRSRTWTVFDSDGRMLGDVALKEDGRITEIGADYLMGVWYTELGVEQVRVYRLIKEDT